jgi:hypothetical protein
MGAVKPWLICPEVEMKTIRIRVLCGLLIAWGPFLLLAACSGGGSGSDGSSTASTASTTSTTGTVHLSLTDNQTSYEAVVLTIVEVGIVASDTATTYYNSTDLNDLPLTVNILDFPHEATLPLVDIEVDLPENGDPVCFNQIRLVLAENDKVYKKGGECIDDVPCNNYVVENGDPTAYALKTPSGQQSGVKILTPSGFCDDTDDPNDVCVGTPNEFCIEEGDDTVYISLDFDPMTAINHTGNENNDKHKYILKPTGIRIIEGDWFTAPDSFIDGLVAIPIYNTASGCGEFATTPLVTVAAFEQGTVVAPVVQTAALADGPVYNSAVCDAWCDEWRTEAPVYNSCRLECGDDLTSPCYYSGGFKLLLPDMGPYDLTATWTDIEEGSFGAAESAVKYNSTVLFELIKE